jgi:hypothetical protein
MLWLLTWLYCTPVLQGGPPPVTQALQTYLNNQGSTLVFSVKP